MSKGRKRNQSKLNKNQLSFDFLLNSPIEIHIPKSSSVNYRKAFVETKKSIIELIRA
ncbi:MAG: hypothetical protein PVF17_04845 [Ignavibacteria bacterium]